MASAFKSFGARDGLLKAGVAPALRALALGFVLILVVAIDAAGWTASTSNILETPKAGGSSFAVVDLDGDHRPDFAIVEPGRSCASAAGGCWAGVWLSASGWRNVPVAGTPEGLQVQAKDVNGDNVADLVFTAAYSGKPVTVLLNDGHGNFSRSDPSAFAGSFSKTGAKISDTCSQCFGGLLAPQELRSSVSRMTSGLAPPQQGSGRLAFTNSESRRHDFLISGAVRAPPLALPL